MHKTSKQPPGTMESSPLSLRRSPGEADVDRFRRRLPGSVKWLILRLLAEYCSPTEVVAAVEKETGHVIAPQTVRHYSRHPKWQDAIERERRALEAKLERLPISSKFWRQKQRMELLDEAREQPGRDLGTARQLLMDAAKEAGQMSEAGVAQTHLGALNLQVINQVLALPREALEEYARTGRLDPATYALDVKVARDLAAPPATSAPAGELGGDQGECSPRPAATSTDEDGRTR